MLYHICIVFSKSIPVAFASPEYVSLDQMSLQISHLLKSKEVFPDKMFKRECILRLKVKLGKSPKNLVRLQLWILHPRGTQQVVFNLKLPICLLFSSLLLNNDIHLLCWSLLFLNTPHLIFKSPTLMVNILLSKLPTSGCILSLTNFELLISADLAGHPD